MSNECKTWDYLTEIGIKEGTYCPYASVCRGMCHFANEIFHPEATAIDPEEGRNRFYARLEKTKAYVNQAKHS